MDDSKSSRILTRRGQAGDMYNVLNAKLLQNPLYKRTGEFMEDYRRLAALQHAIEEEILHELIYTGEAI